jgi:hypothetical protein
MGLVHHPLGGGVGIAAGAVADRDVHPSFREVHLVVGHVELDVEVGVAGHQPVQARRQPLARERHARADDQPGVLALAADLVGLARQLREQAGDGAEERAARLGQLDPADHAVEQPDPQLVFERPDLPAHRTMGQVQLFRGQGHAQPAPGSLEGAQGLERRKPVRHDALMRDGSSRIL